MCVCLCVNISFCGPLTPLHSQPSQLHHLNTLDINLLLCLPIFVCPKCLLHICQPIPLYHMSMLLPVCQHMSPHVMANSFSGMYGTLND